jgi:hypothetical protein
MQVSNPKIGPLSVLLVTCIQYICSALPIGVDNVQPFLRIPAARGVPSVQLYLFHGTLSVTLKFTVEYMGCIANPASS